MQTLVSRFGHLLALGLLIFWNLLLVWYRIHLTGRMWFVFLIWNLILAIIPYLASEAAIYFSRRQKALIPLGLVLLSILFLPNSPYIITDLFHLRERQEMPFWFDTMAIFSAAISGLLLFYVTLFNIRDLLLRWMGKFWAEFSVAVISFLCAYGIYLGRYLRFNSWDVLSNPNDLLEEIGDHLANTSVHTRTVGVTLLYGTFLLTGYGIVWLFRARKRPEPV